MKKWHYSCNIVILLKSNNSGRIFDGTKSAMGFDILMQEVNQSCITDEMIDAVVVLPSLILHMIEWFKNLAVIAIIFKILGSAHLLKSGSNSTMRKS